MLAPMRSSCNNIKIKDLVDTDVRNIVYIRISCLMHVLCLVHYYTAAINTHICMLMFRLVTTLACCLAPMLHGAWKAKIRILDTILTETATPRFCRWGVTRKRVSILKWNPEESPVSFWCLDRLKRKSRSLELCESERLLSLAN